MEYKHKTNREVIDARRYASLPAFQRAQYAPVTPPQESSYTPETFGVNCGIVNTILSMGDDNVTTNFGGGSFGGGGAGSDF